MARAVWVALVCRTMPFQAWWDTGRFSTMSRTASRIIGAGTPVISAATAGGNQAASSASTSNTGRQVTRRPSASSTSSAPRRSQLAGQDAVATARRVMDQPPAGTMPRHVAGRRVARRRRSRPRAGADRRPFAPAAARSSTLERTRRRTSPRRSADGRARGRALHRSPAEPATAGRPWPPARSAAGPRRSAGRHGRERPRWPQRG